MSLHPLFFELEMVLCSDTVLRTSEPSDCVPDGSDLISTINGSLSLVVEIRSDPTARRQLVLLLSLEFFHLY